MIYSKNGIELNEAFSKNGDTLSKAYKVNGTVAWEKKTHLVSRIFKSTLLYDILEIGSGTQGIACDSLSQNILQLYAGGIFAIDISDGSYGRMGGLTNLGHGSAGMFAKEKIAPTDLYPPLYVSTGLTQTVNDVLYGRFLEVYVGESQNVINKAFFVPLEKGYSLFAFDLENGIAYHVVLIQAGGSYIESYDISSATEFTEGTYSPTPVSGNWLLSEPIEKFYIDFIADVQSLSFFDGLIAILSDDNGVTFIDVATHEVYLNINNGIVGYEREGIDFIVNPSTGKTDMILSARQPTFNVYYRYEFIL